VVVAAASADTVSEAELAVPPVTVVITPRMATRATTVMSSPSAKRAGLRRTQLRMAVVIGLAVCLIASSRRRRSVVARTAVTQLRTVEVRAAELISLEYRGATARTGARRSWLCARNAHPGSSGARTARLCVR
jgi:hypothetical protein